MHTACMHTYMHAYTRDSTERVLLLETVFSGNPCGTVHMLMYKRIISKRILLLDIARYAHKISTAETTHHALPQACIDLC